MSGAVGMPSRARHGERHGGSRQTPRSPISSSLAPARDSFGAYAGRARRLLGTGLSIL